MCIPTEAFMFFLTIISTTPVTTEPGQVTVHARAYDTVWQEDGTHWCTAQTAEEGWAQRYAMGLTTTD